MSEPRRAPPPNFSMQRTALRAAADAGRWVSQAMSTRPLPASPRLRFREYTAGDVAALAEVFADPYAKQFYPNHSQPEKLASWIEWSQRGYAANGFGLWALELLSSGAFAGDAGLTLQRVDGELLLEIGYHIHPSLRQQGLATEAAHACLSWAFEHTNHEVVCSIVHPANAASARVAERVHRFKRICQTQSGEALLFYTTRRAAAE